MSSTTPPASTIPQRHGVGTDTEQYAAETAHLLDTIDAIFYVCDERGVLQRWNESLGELTGCEDDKLASMAIQECFVASHRPRVEQAIGAASTEGETTWTAPIETVDGRRQFEFTATLTESPAGEIRLTGTGRPVPEPAATTGEAESLRKLNRLMTDQSLDTDERIERLLECGRARLGATHGLLSAIDAADEEYTVTATAGEELIPAGTRLDLSATLCQETIEQAAVLTLGLDADEQNETAFAGNTLPVGGYVGARITIDGAVHGTVCFVGLETETQELTDGDRRFLRALRRSIRHVLEQEHEQARLKRAIEAAPIGVAISRLDEDCQPLTYVNEEFEELTGYSEADIVGNRCCSLQGEATDPETAQRLQRAIEAHETETAEIRNYRKDGTLFWNRVSVAPLEDHSGEVTEFVSFQENVTERKERESELRESERQFEAVFNDPQMFVGLTDVDGTLTRINQPAMELIDQEESDLVGTPVWETPWWNHDPELQKRMKDWVKQAANGEYVELEADVSAAVDGELIVSGIIRPVTDEDGDVVSLIMSARDVTERTSYQEQLERYKTYTDDLLDAIDDVFYVLDEDGYFERWNQTMCEVTGYSDEELAEMQAIELFDESDRDHVAEAIAETFETGTSRVEAPFRTKDGESIPHEFSASTVEAPCGEPRLTGIGRDISERVAAEQQLRESERQLTTLMNNIPGMVYQAVNEPDWPMEFVSEGAAELTGYDAETLESGAVNWGQDVIHEGNQELWETVQECLERREPFRVAYPIETADGEIRWCKEQGRGVFDEDGTLQALEGVILDITERKQRQQEANRTRKLLQQAQRLASVGGCVLSVTDDRPEAIAWSAGISNLLGWSLEGTVPFEDVIDAIVATDQKRVLEAVNQSIRTGSGFDVEFRIEGEQQNHWLRAIGEPVIEAGVVESLRVAIQEISDQKRHQLALESIQEATRGLLGTDSESEVAELVASVAAEVLDVDATGLYELDTAAGAFELLATAGDCRDLCDGGELIDIDATDSVLWETFASGSTSTLAEHHDETELLGSARDGVLVPVGEHGVFVALSREETVEAPTQQLVETLVAAAEAAFDRLENEAALRERDDELEAQNDRLKRQVQINDIIRSINKSLLQADSREDVETAVCDRLTAEADIELAWIGDLDTNGRLQPRTWAGAHPEYLDAVSFDGAEQRPEPAYRAASEESSVVVENVLGDVTAADWRRHALLFDLRSVVCVPLTYDEYTYGVLAVYAETSEAFGTLEETVFRELGETIANSINAVETRRALHADTAVAVDLTFSDPETFCHRLAARADCPVTYSGLATATGDTTRLFFTVPADSTEATERVLDELVSVSTFSTVGDGTGEQQFVASVSGPTVVSRIVRHSGRLCSMAATEEGVTATAELPPEMDVREFVSLLEEQFGPIELAARQTIERERTTRQDHATTLLDTMTDRQREVLRTAYLSGFFEWPRESTGEEVAELLDVSQPTVNRHLRLSQGRLFAELFGEEPALADPGSNS